MPYEAATSTQPGPSTSRRTALSPSRASDFMQCPLLYRFRVIDRLPEPPSPAAARGTLVHSVLERVFDVPAPERTPEHAKSLLAPQWASLVEDDAELAQLVEDGPDGLQSWLDDAASLVDRWFTLEDPQHLEPAERELYVETDADGLTLRGYVDRLDVAPDGRIRVVDYKTGRSPSQLFEAKALFQMKFYALVLWRLRGVVPSLLQLVYLGNGEIVRFEPTEHELVATERKIKALWSAIEQAAAQEDWRPRPTKLCDWCAHKSICPAWGGTPPPLPSSADQLAIDPARSGAEAVTDE